MSSGAHDPEAGVGRRLGPFVLLRRLALTGSAEVFEARCEESTRLPGCAPGRIVVIKRLLPHALEDAARVERLCAEARLGLSLDHPHVVRTHGLLWLADGETDAWDPATGSSARGEPLLVTGLVEGGPLYHADARDLEPTEPAVVAALGQRLCEALAEVHARGVVHGDVCPRNLLLTTDGTLVLIDLGSACPIDAHPPGGALAEGRGGYASPEQLAGEPLGTSSDLFSAAVILWELAEGRRLFPANRRGPQEPGPREPSPPASLADDRNAAPWGHLHAALSPRPEDRPASAAALAADLEAWLAADSHPSPEHILAAWRRGAAQASFSGAASAVARRPTDAD
ncbi:MAG: serine/threonine protein kinase [Deltaproteobacteria bacterium]|nr:serine/threonine protein kinase [Deltaproteobacteria bacterium]MCB9786059.1 serine/threonine protein kinase [Deltaproteobacteria bacterium]